MPYSKEDSLREIFSNKEDQYGMRLVIACAGGQGGEPSFLIPMKYSKYIFYFHLYLSYGKVVLSHKNKAKNKGRE